ncbi:ion channel [Luteimonas cucumeris]|uniref:Ion channel n=1 Tax=Luteimonas cucumeris TaxID=985012 RepID=A0A562LEV0_9GAMM|nr:ion channel [Luteimonas cucumeris]TWI06139.1 ion channel [Luteimonas cucumeris]
MAAPSKPIPEDPLGFGRWTASLRSHPSGWLLGVQLLTVLVNPLMENTAAGRAVFGAFGIVVLALALWVVNRSHAVNWIAWLLAVPSVALSLAANIGGQTQLLPMAHMLESALYFYAAGALTAYMLADNRVSMDELLAAGATFTLLAWAFAFAFSVCQSWYPGSFTAAVNTESPRTWMELLFLSFSLLSGVGLSDIVPVTPPARALTMLAMFAGVMYIAIVVSRLIALTTLRLRRD